ncbi:histidine phosphatase family protein [Streptomyces sp. LaPpAH-108]|uniref:histidine phosphatase family protein n=1 Tax=Streptomyces sp. LaPpAH-108 TaxID=1155714 RepID=UPI0003763327|nr:histidine phosphatase family protein [Streptomyces sp. LaPpAH-108]
MTSRVLLVSPASSQALRQARFYDGLGPLDASGAARARAAAGSLSSVGRADRVVRSPGARCHETATELGLDAEELPELATLDAGRWRGRTLEEVGAVEPQELMRWLADPEGAPHGGESVRALCERVGAWLESAQEDGRTLGVVEPEVVRAAVVHALALPPETFWRLDVPPLTVTELSGRAGRWNLRLGRPLTE